MKEQHHQHNPSQVHSEPSEQLPKQYLPQQNPPQIHSENPSNTTEKGSQKLEVLELPARKEFPKGGFFFKGYWRVRYISKQMDQIIFMIIKS